jgi:hypothetical protein
MLVFAPRKNLTQKAVDVLNTMLTTPDQFDDSDQLHAHVGRSSQAG